MYKKIKILIITHNFYPDLSPRSFRATELAKEFYRQGHEVTLMAPEKKGIESFLTEYPIVFKSLGNLKWKIFNFKSFGILGRLYNKAVNRLLSLLFEYPNMEIFFKVRKALKKENDQYDLLISIAVPYPIHWGVASIWSKKHRKVAKVWVADCGDPYCLQENDTFRPPFYFQWVEKWFMRKATYITVPTLNSIKGYFPEFHSKIQIIPQGFKFEEVRKRPEIMDGIVRFGYGGGFIPGRRDPKEFIQFLVQLPVERRFEFHVYTHTPQYILPYIQNDPRILIHNPKDRLEFLYTISGFQFVVNFSNKGTVQTPSKLIDYGIINKPILNIETGNLDKEAVVEFLNGNYRKSLKVECLENYRIENVCRKFLSLADASK
ncbi:glycosyltransferase [Schleiferia thermophila]|jgi:hypothetical protein|uniref:glycosyltransferase n=1 Tax=Schleiferia thermophila TaxID=884107 RepID=UPI002FD8FA27